MLKLKSIFNDLKKLSGKLWNGLNKLQELGLDFDNYNNDDNVLTFVVTTTSGNELTVTLTPTFKSEVYNVEYESKGRKDKKSDVKVDDIDDLILEVVKDWFDEDIDEIIKSAKYVQCSLVKQNDGVYLTKIYSNTDIPYSSEMVNLAVESPELLDSLTDQEQSFKIYESHDGIEVEPSDDFSVDTYENLVTMLGYAQTLLFTMQYVHWNSKGVHFDDLHSHLDEWIDCIREQIDELAEITVECADHVPYPGIFADCPANMSNLNDAEFCAETGFETVQKAILCYVDVLSCLYCNFPSDIQSVLDEYIRCWKKIANYKIKARLDSK